MEPAPLPPHERPWRHPSELGPSDTDVDAGRTGTSWPALVAGGLVLVAAVAAIVVTSMPTPASPDAVAATTIPSVVRGSEPQAAASRPVAPATVRLHQEGVTIDRTLALTGAPAAVSSKHVGDPATLDRAASAPPPDQQVILLTATHTYLIEWRDLERIEAPDGSAVVDIDGHLLAVFVADDLRILVD